MARNEIELNSTFLKNLINYRKERNLVSDGAPVPQIKNKLIIRIDSADAADH